MIYLMVYYDFKRSLAAIIILHPNFAKYKAVYFPIPELPPVITAYLSERS